jgi:hypothetical protein
LKHQGAPPKPPTCSTKRKSFCSNTASDADIHTLQGRLVFHERSSADSVRSDVWHMAGLRYWNINADWQYDPDLRFRQIVGPSAAGRSGPVHAGHAPAQDLPMLKLSPSARPEGPIRAVGTRLQSYF